MRGLERGLRWLGLLGLLVFAGCQGPSMGTLVVEVTGIEAAVSPPVVKVYNQSNQVVASHELSGTWQSDLEVGTYRLVPSVAEASLPGGQSVTLYPQTGVVNLTVLANQTAQVKLTYAPNNANLVGNVNLPAALKVSLKLSGPEVRTLTNGENRLYGLTKGGYALEAPTMALGSDGKLYRLQVQGLPVEAGSKAYHSFSVSYFADPNENWCTAASSQPTSVAGHSQESLRSLAAKVLTPPPGGMGDFVAKDVAPGRLIVYRKAGMEKVALSSVSPYMRSFAKLATGWEIVEVKAGMEEPLAKQLLASGVALRVEPDRYVELQESPQDSHPMASLESPSLVTPPNDPLYTTPIGNNVDKTPQQVLAVHNMEAAWNLLKPGCPAVVVAVIDGGMADTSFVQENLWPNLTPLSSWFDVAKLEQGTVNYNQVHGVSVAGIIAAVTNDAKTYLGLGYNLIKVLPIAHNLTVSGSMLAIQYAMGSVSAGGQTFTNPTPAKVVNMSYGGAGFFQAEQDLFKLGVAAGLVFVGGSGNSGTSSVAFPAAYPEVIAAGGFDAQQAPGVVRHPMSQYGSALDFVAPFQHYLYRTEAMDSWMGTSYASPSIAAMVALHLYAAQHYGSKGANPFEVAYACLKSAANPTFDEQIGWGAPKLDKVLDPSNSACYR